MLRRTKSIVLIILMLFSLHSVVSLAQDNQQTETGPSDLAHRVILTLSVKKWEPTEKKASQYALYLMEALLERGVGTNVLLDMLVLATDKPDRPIENKLLDTNDAIAAVNASLEKHEDLFRKKDDFGVAYRKLYSEIANICSADGDSMRDTEVWLFELRNPYDTLTEGAEKADAAAQRDILEQLLVSNPNLELHFVYINDGNIQEAANAAIDTVLRTDAAIAPQVYTHVFSDINNEQKDNQSAIYQNLMTLISSHICSGVRNGSLTAEGGQTKWTLRYDHQPISDAGDTLLVFDWSVDLDSVSISRIGNAAAQTLPPAEQPAGGEANNDQPPAEPEGIPPDQYTAEIDFDYKAIFQKNGGLLWLHQAPAGLYKIDIVLQSPVNPMPEIQKYETVADQPVGISQYDSGAAASIDGGTVWYRGGHTLWVTTDALNIPMEGWSIRAFVNGQTVQTEIRNAYNDGVSCNWELALPIMTLGQVLIRLELLYNDVVLFSSETVTVNVYNRKPVANENMNLQHTIYTREAYSGEGEPETVAIDLSEYFRDPDMDPVFYSVDMIPSELTNAWIDGNYLMFTPSPGDSEITLCIYAYDRYGDDYSVPSEAADETPVTNQPVSETMTPEPAQDEQPAADGVGNAGQEDAPPSQTAAPTDMQPTPPPAFAPGDLPDDAGKFIVVTHTMEAAASAGDTTSEIVNLINTITPKPNAATTATVPAQSENTPGPPTAAEVTPEGETPPTEAAALAQEQTPVLTQTVIPTPTPTLIPTPTVTAVPTPSPTPIPNPPVDTSQPYTLLTVKAISIPDEIDRWHFVFDPIASQNVLPDGNGGYTSIVGSDSVFVFRLESYSENAPLEFYEAAKEKNNLPPLSEKLKVEIIGMYQIGKRIFTLPEVKVFAAGEQVFARFTVPSGEIIEQYSIIPGASFWDQELPWLLMPISLTVTNSAPEIVGTKDQTVEGMIDGGFWDYQPVTLAHLLGGEPILLNTLFSDADTQDALSYALEISGTAGYRVAENEAFTPSADGQTEKWDLTTTDGVCLLDLTILEPGDLVVQAIVYDVGDQEGGRVTWNVRARSSFWCTVVYAAILIAALLALIAIVLLIRYLLLPRFRNVSVSLRLVDPLDPENAFDSGAVVTLDHFGKRHVSLQTLMVLSQLQPLQAMSAQTTSGIRISPASKQGAFAKITFDRNAAKQPLQVNQSQKRQGKPILVTEQKLVLSVPMQNANTESVVLLFNVQATGQPPYTNSDLASWGRV